jgi:hypothetical protein
MNDEPPASDGLDGLIDELSYGLIVKSARRGSTVRYKNKTLLSTVDPIAQAERTAAGVKRQDRTLYFCPSPLLGYGLCTLLSGITADSAVVCVETDGELFALSRSSIDTEILNHPRLALVDIRDGAGLCRFVREKWGARVFRRVEAVRLSGGWQLDGAGYEAMEELLRSGMAVDWSNAMTLVKLGRRFTCNVLRNLALLGRCQSMAEISFGSKPVLTLGAGPSLDPLLDSLQEAGLFGCKAGERPFALVCVDTCLSLLRERGIIPDLAVVLESQFWNLRDFAGSLNTGIPAAADLSAYPGTVQLLGGPVFFFFTPWTPLRLFERLKSAGLLPPILPPLGSVGLTAVELALRLSAGPVIVGGIDFSFTLDRIHARSSPAHLALLLSQNRFTGPFNAEAVFRPGVFDTLSKSNNPVKSNPAMRTYRNLFEQEFSCGRIRDVAGTGLPLGLETLTIEEVIGALSEGPAQRHNSTETQKEPAQRQNMPGTSCFGAFVGTAFEEKPGLAAFITKEKSMLEELRAMLTGSASSASIEELDTLLDEADYLWAHFPDCAGAGGRRPPASDLTFLKRVRVEIDPFIKLWELAETTLSVT